ncbi:hypothetical protein [Chitinophaga sp. XS-30]|uniref:hypothetical protein n=1 Tax=Chitinophaga sp. XS-30 TaxID=2604421 RepID=UPI0011DD6CC9|nr:hypothetical protein [Chitinophaga sp. XS-30]QEH42338.1 hypothetical protein FW415_16245 [Chitinophaga sp. XS-30]
MKKFFLAFALFFISISSSFAYQQALTAGPPINYAGMNVSINMNCSYVYFQCTWSNSASGNGNGSTVAYSDDATLIGEYNYSEGYNSQGYSRGVFSYRYWGSVQVYLSAFNCTAQALLEWMP